ncbi:MAG: hypothetical protein AMXMBFR16_12630 [Candidatus Uhrbacteria bacterium]
MKELIDYQRNRIEERYDMRAQREVVYNTWKQSFSESPKVISAPDTTVWMVEMKYGWCVKMVNGCKKYLFSFPRAVEHIV